MVFAGLAVLFPVAVATGRHDAWATIQGVFTSAEYTFGPRSSEAHHAIYLRAIRSLSLHTITGGLALLAATSQFVPTFRRRWPLLHRATGALVVTLVAASMVGSVVLLMSHPLAATLSGAGFGLGLLSLCGLTLVELTLAVLAVHAGAYRTHMGWMALMFASLLTAPALRAQWLLFGASGLTMDETNLVIAMFLVPEMIVLMTVWMLRVGARDIGIDAPRSIIPPSALRMLAVASAIVVLHEGVLAPLGFDLLRSWRGAGHPLPRSAVLWGLATAVLAWRAPDDLVRLGAGQPTRAATAVCAIASAVGGLAIARSLGGGDLQTLAQESFYAAWAVLIILLVVLGHRATLGHAGPWDAQWLYLAFAPALWPSLAVAFVPLGVGMPVATTVAMGDGLATVAMLGFASAFGLRLVVRQRRSASSFGPMAVT